jgi:hypothetical protein
VSEREDDDFRRKLLIDDAEGESPQNVSAEVTEVDWPTLGSLPDSFYRLLKGALKVDRGDGTTVSVPGSDVKYSSSAPG